MTTPAEAFHAGSLSVRKHVEYTAAVSFASMIAKTGGAPVSKSGRLYPRGVADLGAAGTRA
ncbi:hypothetical protein [Sphingopyxis sp. MSC1_008]|uniref:hypothetical protein n=1 Tax=Sphingopyxis sp. MSC1_008 TaxID=2909265 RepID=UPI0020BD711B|nr:hypothetical protein [Sphingopyxis sp. MSC1_008]